MGEAHVPHGQTVSRTSSFPCVSPMAPDGVFLSHLQAGRNSTELLNLTITEISSTKPRRANRNAQGSQRSWAQGSEQNKTNNQSANNQSINQSIDPLINQSINPINQSIDESISIQVNRTRNKANQQTFVSKAIGKTKQNNKISDRQQPTNWQKEGQQQS